MSGCKRSMEEEINSLEKKARFYSEKLEKAKLELEKKKNIEFNNFVEVMRSDSCTICSEPLADCVDNIGRRGISSYKCECSRQRIVHTKCWTRDFRCSCRVMAIAPFAGDVLSNSMTDDIACSRDIAIHIGNSADSIEGIIGDMEYVDQVDSITSLQRMMMETPGIPSHLIECINSIGIESRDINMKMDRILREAKVIYAKSNRCCRFKCQ